MFLKLVFNISKNCLNFIMIYDFYLKVWRLKIEKVKKLVANLHDKTEYLVLIITLKKALNHWLVFKKVHKVIKFNQNVWLKRYIDMI